MGDWGGGGRSLALLAPGVPGVHGRDARATWVHLSSSFFLLLVRVIVIPLLLQLFENAAAGQAGYGAHAVQDQRAIEVVGLVLPDAGNVTVGGFLDGVALQVLGLQAEAFAAPDFGGDVGETEAALFAFFFVFGFGEDGIDVDADVLFFAGGVHHEEADVLADLRTGQPDASGFLHQLNHPKGEFAQFWRKLRDRLARFSQARVG